jgi:hypothetical protein
MEQLTLEHAIEQGQEAMTACIDKAQRKDPEFSRKAEGSDPGASTGSRPVLR